MNNINVIYEDNHIIVVEKPFNVPTQEDSSKDLDIFNIVKKYIKEKYNKPGEVYLGLVHRLDRPTGGIMVFARTSKAASRLSDMIRKGELHKQYLAVVHGKTKENEKLIHYLNKDEKTHSSYIDNKNGKESILEYNTLAYDKENDISLIEVNLITGRHHQIRVQMSSINHPLYGDQRYGVQDKKQLALYAYKLEFIHPVKKENMIFKYFPKDEGIWNLFKDIKEKL